MNLLGGLLFLGVLVGVFFLLAIVAFVHAARADRTARQFKDRLDALEKAVAGLGQVPGLRPPVVPTGRELTEEPGVEPRRREAPARSALEVPRQPDPVVRHVAPVDWSRSAPEPMQSSAAPQHADLLPKESAPARDRVDTTDLGLEQLIGGRWLLYAGVAAVVLGMTYFVKFAFDNGWISERLRVAVGIAAGVSLIGSGMRFRSRGLALFGQALAGGGLVVLYVSIYAALHFYRMVTPGPAFVLMTFVTAGAAWLADRQRSQPIAAVALLGGFATPLLVGGERHLQIVLFTYIAIPISGSAALARRHAWPLLGAAAYVCTFLLVIDWVFSSYRAERWLQTELFLTLYVCLFGYLLWALLTSSERSARRHLSVAMLATAPLVYHLASLILLNEHPGPWLIYLVGVTVAGLVVSQRARVAWLRPTILILVSMPFLSWLRLLDYPRWYGASVLTAFLIYALHLAAQWEATGEQEEGERAPLMHIVHAQLNGLLLPLSLYVFFETRFAAWSSWMVGGLALWNAGLAWIARERAPRLQLQFTALGATLAAAALVLAFDGPAVAVGWAAEGVFIGWLATRERSRPLAIASAVLIAAGGLRIAELLARPLAVADQPLFNARTFAAALVIALCGWLAWRIGDDEAATVRVEARNGLIVFANLLALAALTADIQAWFAGRALDAHLAGEPRDAAGATLAGQVTLSVTWALYAVGLIATGIRRRYAPARYLAIVLFGVTVLKVLLYDVAGLDRLNRMLSVLGVGVLLLVASYLYHRMAERLRTEVRP